MGTQLLLRMMLPFSSAGGWVECSTSTTMQPHERVDRVVGPYGPDRGRKLNVCQDKMGFLLELVQRLVDNRCRLAGTR